MEYTNLVNTGLRISRLYLGTMSFETRTNKDGIFPPVGAGPDSYSW
ncbi:hypothetical protein [Streptococcus gallolyticus]|uniref:Aldo/keto reductase n=1 Tax=Streptococcus gallolyticus TaxID=315405 RepID=A0A1I7FFS4_9STRE|nr:hypothetical protein [Streptococcus gallolyticus]MCO7178374.1 hypothetical protein [Streptococcus gallolyticus]MCY7165984.1 hypothetical protein [Streptococcus gallolyticus subsp. gallolyticus]MCY7183083.1 hypothetical protein [Streptococcus gallolyticus subsp. gallolyticus]SFU34965.1 hypothetical protein SAMN05660328_101363 [Streptococcus gallolyticus]